MYNVVCNELLVLASFYHFTDLFLQCHGFSKPLVTAKTVFACITLLCGVPFKRLISSLIMCTIW